MASSAVRSLFAPNPASRLRPLAWLGAHRHDLLAVLFLFLVTLVFFAPLLRGQTFSLVASTQAIMEPWFDPEQPVPRQFPQSDQANTFYPWVVFASKALRAGELPLWDPYIFGGHPFFGNGESNLLYPPRLILTRLFSPSWAQDLFLFSHVWASGLAMLLFLRRYGLGVLAALLGATVWMFNSFSMGWLLLGHIIAMIALLPLALLLAREATIRRSGSYALWLGAVLALMVLGSNILMVIIAWVTVGIYYGALLLGSIIRDWRAAPGRSWRSRLPLALIALPILTGLSAFGLGAVQLLTTGELATLMSRVPASYEHYVNSWSVSIADLRAILLPDLIVTDRTLNYRLWFVGWLPIVLVPFALLRPGGRGALLGAAGLIAYVTGTPVTWIGMHLIPGLSHFKPPGRMLWVWGLLLAILAAIGADVLLRWLSTRRPATRRWSTALGLLLVVVSAAQLIAYGRTINPPFQPRTAAMLYPSTPLVEQLRAAGPNARIVMLRTITGPDLWAPPIFDGSIPLVQDLRTTGGYQSLLPATTMQFWRIVEGEDPEFVADNPPQVSNFIEYFPTRIRYDLLPSVGINLIAAVPDVTPEWLAAHWPGLRVEPIYRGPDGWIYRLPDSRGVAYVSYRVAEAADNRAVLAQTVVRGGNASDLLAQEDRPPTVPLPPDGKCAGQERVAQQVAAQTANTMTIRASSACAGLLVVNQSWFPGWQATVDGRPAPLLRVNYLARGVAVPAGEHEVRFVYAPRSFTVGMILTGLTSIGLLCLAVRGLNDWRKRPLCAAHESC